MIECVSCQFQPHPWSCSLVCLGNDLAELFYSALPCASHLSCCSPEDVALSKTVPRDHSNLRKTVCHISLPHIPVVLSALVGGVPSWWFPLIVSWLLCFSLYMGINCPRLLQLNSGPFCRDILVIAFELWSDLWRTILNSCFHPVYNLPGTERCSSHGSKRYFSVIYY